MKAVVLQTGYKPVIKAIPIPVPRPGYALVKLKAAALNRRDYWITKGLYPGIEFDKVMGGDGSGIVVKVGSDTDRFWLRKRVVINSVHYWGPDEDVSSHKTRLLGVPLNGTLAEYVEVPVDRLSEIPSHLTFEQAAAIPIAGITAYRALVKRGEFKPGNKVLVTGIGSGVGCFAAQFAVALGATVFVTSSQNWKIEKAIKEIGVAGGVNYTDDEQNWDKQLRERAGLFDIIIDGAAGPNMNKFIRLLNRGGRIVSYGGTTLEKPTIDIFRLFLCDMKLVGTSLGSDKDWKEMLQLIEQKKIVPIIDSIKPFSESIDAINAMGATGSKQFGKVVIQIDPIAKL